MRHIIVILLCIIFGGNIVAVKISLAGLTPLAVAGLRFGIATIVIAIWACAAGHSFNIKRSQIIHIFILGLILFAQILFMNQGVSRTSASRASILINIQPFFVLFIAHYSRLNERITLTKFTGILLGAVGVLFLLFDKQSISTNINLGDIMVIMSSFCWAFSAIYIKQIIDGFQVFHVTFYPMIIATLLFFLQGILSGEQMIVYFDTKIILAIFYQSIIATSFGFIAWYYMMKKYGVTALHSFTFIMPIAGVVFCELILGDTVTINIILSLSLVITGIMLLNYRLFP